MAVMPIGMVATFVAILVAAIIFAMMPQGGPGIAEGVPLLAKNARNGAPG